MREEFDWLKPQPLWQGPQAFRQADFFRPQLLKFQSDAFMEQFLAEAGNPAALAGRIVTGEPGQKLYQPLHGCFYLVCASLCCRVPGFPDRLPRRAEGESVFFVLRRKANGTEYAWAPEGENKGWQTVAGQELHPGEERLPLFPAPAAAGRTLYFGYLPMASRETYAAPLADSPLDPDSDPRLEELSARFLNQIGSALDTVDSGLRRRVSVYLLLDLWDYFGRELPTLAEALKQGDTSVLTGGAATLAIHLSDQNLGSGVSLAAALGEVARRKTELDGLADADPLPAVFSGAYNLHSHSFPGLSAAVKAALPPAPTAESPKLPADGRYLLRLIYERPQCDPPRRWFSQPTTEFTLAAFLDPDAPARPVRIDLPDMSLANLRRFSKQVSFSMSAALRNKLSRLTNKESDLLAGDDVGPEGTFNLGHVCSLSIPIITICAFILLLIIAALLDMIFKWLPFLKICFPLRK